MLTVSELTRRIKALIERSPLTKQLEVSGEISNLTIHRSGHLYFTLKDEGAQIAAVQFGGSAARNRGYQPREGDRVTVNAEVTVYEPRGQYQLLVSGMKPAGVGELYRLFLERKERLQREGLFDARRKRPVPRMPRHIAVVTSPTGAVVEDIRQTITRRFPFVKLSVVPALMQGDGAATSVWAALETVLALPAVDVAIVARGGGSFEDLWPFNDEGLVRAAAAYPVPLVAAIGHETDVTLIELAADLRASTPTAAAEAVTPHAETLFQELNALQYTLTYLTRQRLYREMQRADELAERLTQKMENRMVRENARLSQMQTKLQNGAKAYFVQKNAELEKLALKLEGLDAQKTLERGFTLTLQNGKTLRSVKDLDENLPIETIFADGNALSTLAQPR